MSAQSKKGEEKKTLRLGWSWLLDLLAKLFALVKGFVCCSERSSTPLASAPPLECKHTVIEQAEEYYGPEEHQYTTYWYCDECGEEIFSDGDDYI